MRQYTRNQNNFYKFVLLLELVSNCCYFSIGYEHLVNLRDFPYMVRIQYQNSNDPLSLHYCSGTLLHQNCVLTAASCMLNANISTIRISADESAAKQRVKIIEIPGEYGDDTMNAGQRADMNVAVLALYKKNTMAKNKKQNVQLNWQHVGHRKLLNALAWRHTSAAQQDNATLYAATTTGISRKHCQKLLNISNVLHMPRCLGKTFESTNDVYGTVDYGGPVLHNGRQIGIVAPWQLQSAQHMRHTTIVYTSLHAVDVQRFLNSRIPMLCDLWPTK